MSDCVLEMEEEAGNMPCHRVASEEEEEKDFDIPRVKAGKDAFKGPKGGKQQRDVSNHNWGRCSTTRVFVDICLTEKFTLRGIFIFYFRELWLYIIPFHFLDKAVFRDLYITCSCEASRSIQLP